jgi:hypothetical protein
MAQRFGVTQTSIRRYEWRNRRPNREQLAIYAAALGIDPAELIVLAGYVPPPNLG